MFDFSWGEIMLIGVVALIVIGPKELPAVLRTIGQWVGKVRRMAAEFQGQFQEAMREAEMADLKKHVDDLNDTTRGLNKQFDPLKDFSTSPGSSAANPPSANPTTANPTPPSSPDSASGDAAVPPVPAESHASSVDASVPVPEAAPAVADTEIVSSPAAPPPSEHEERRA